MPLTLKIIKKLEFLLINLISVHEHEQAVIIKIPFSFLNHEKNNFRKDSSNSKK